VAGNTSGASDTSADTVTFGTTTGTNGTLLAPIVIDANRNIKSLAFTALNSTAGFVIGSTTGNTLYLTTGGSAAIPEGEINTETINAPLVIGTSGGASTYTFNDTGDTNSMGLDLGGTITGGGGSGTLALTFNGGSGGGGGTYNIVSGIISDSGTINMTTGVGTNVTSVTISGTIVQGGGNHWDFTGANTYSGGTTLSSGYLVIGNNNALGSGTLSVGSNSIFETDGGNYTIANNVTWTNTGSSNTAFSGAGNLSVTGTTTFGTSPSQRYYNEGSGTLTLSGTVNLSASTTNAAGDFLAGPGTWNISGTIADGLATGGAQTLGFFGPGTLDLSGHTTSTGAWGFYGGTVILDDSSDTGTKIGAGTLTLGGVNLQLYKGGGTQSTGAVSFAGGGQVNISQTGGGSEILAMGAISNSATSTGVTAVDFQAAGIATTTSSTTNGTNVASSLIGSTANYVVGTQGSADWAAISSGTVTTFTTANSAGYTTLATTPTGANNLVNGSFTTSSTGTVQTLKIIATDNGADTLSLGGVLTLGASGGILDSTTSNSNGYTISGANIALGTGVTVIQQYGNSALTISSNIIGNGGGANGSILMKAGPGTLILGGTNTFGGSLVINAGTVSASSDANLGTVQTQTNAVTVTAATNGSTAVTVSSVPTGLVLGSSLLGSTVAAISGTSITLATSYSGSNITGSTPETFYSLATLVLDGGTLDATSSFSLSETSPTVNREIILGSNGGTIQVESGQSLTVAGNITQESHTLTDSASLTKTGSGTLVLSGVESYTGGTYLNGGTLQTAPGGTLFGTSVPGNGSAIVNPFVVNNGATLDLDGTIQYVGPLTLVNGTLEDSSNSGAILHAYSLTAETGTISLIVGDFSSVASGIQSDFIKTGTGTVVLSGANIYSGGTEINGGVLQLDSAETGTTGPLGGKTNNGAEAGISFGGGTLQYVPGTNTFDYSSRIVNSSSAITIDTNGGTVIYASALSTTNTGGLTEADSNGSTGTLELTAANNYSGPTTVTAGTLQVKTAGTLGVTTNALAVNGGTLDLDGTSQTVGNLTSSASSGVILDSASTGTSTLTVGNGTTALSTGTYTGAIQNGGAKVALTKTGLGTTILTGTNTYTGATTVNAGELGVQTGGSMSSGSALKVTANGTTAGNFAVGAAAGNSSVAAVTVATLSLTSTGTGVGNEPILSFNITGNGTNDSLTSTGILTLTGSTYELNLTDTASGATTNTLMTWLASGSTGTTTGNIDLVLNGTDLGTSSSYLSISTINAGTNDILVFNAAAVPEPSTWAMLIFGGGLMVFWQRRRLVQS
jgi:autotransporter-associated beta strand protein